MKKLNIILIIVSFAIIYSCTSQDESDQSKYSTNKGVEYSPEKDAEIQRYNLEYQKKYTGERTPCDTLAVKEYILNNYPEGTYLVDFDITSTYTVPKPALIYYGKKRNLIFAVVAKSKPGERLIETKNIVGYDQSFIDLDSTDLGTAFFYLTLFKCENGNFSVIWEEPIPSHGGFNTFSIKRWRYKNFPYVQVNFHYARGIGHINYNYFLINGIKEKPHLLMTYEGINFMRTIANVNDDDFPDYYEHIYYDLGDRVFSKDSVAFVWNKKDSVYVNTKNKRQTRPY